MFENYYTPEQLKALERRRKVVGDEEIAAVEAAWAEIADRVRLAMESGVSPSSVEAVDLVKAWRALTQRTIEGFSGGDPELDGAARNFLRSEPQVGRRWGMTGEMSVWIGSALEFHREA